MKERMVDMVLFQNNKLNSEESGRGPSGNLYTIFKKEFSDQLSSTRFLILFFLILITGVASLYVAAASIRSTVEESGTDFIFLRLFTTSSSSLPPFTSFISFLGPLVGLSIGFDAINGEQNGSTLSRLLAQPVYRDDVINGKFLAGLAVLTIMTFALGGLVSGFGIMLTGIPPTAEEIARLVIYLLLNIVFMAFWLAISILFSILFRQTATSALGGIALWLLFTVFVPILAGPIANAVYPVKSQDDVISQLRNITLQQNISRVSPSTLYDEASAVLLSPGVRTLGPILMEQIYGATPGPLPLGQSLLLIWPHITGLIAGTLIIFGIAYTIFLRREIRA
ncbi:ABC transporter permease [Calorimonas adulescens]|uniref:ABC transporter permease n=1 Tax=Calorimonas adulescens TaxID=2606906 RepID=UPI001EF05878|nr:ABC transporter permease subunit [Calorimonas adulescens]